MGKEFKDYSNEELLKIKKEQCTNCKFADSLRDADVSKPRSDSDILNYIYCNYIDANGHSRNCPVENCKLKEERDK